MNEMQFRHEYKHYLNYSDYLVTRNRLRAVMKTDPYAGKDGFYQIRSLYFDNASDKALQEKISGLSEREKFRIRCYGKKEEQRREKGRQDFDSVMDWKIAPEYSFIRLEKKVKKGGLGYKVSAPLSYEETEKILHGEYNWMAESREGLIIELYSKMKMQGLRPKTIVDYTREPYVYPAGNVRVTLDYDIRTGVLEKNMLSQDILTVPASPGMVILEVKYDNFLPDMIRDVVQQKYREEGAFSKYEACRRFG